MRKKRFYFLAVATLAAAMVAALLPYPVGKTVIIKVPIDEVAAQFNRLSNWKNWYPASSQVDSIIVSNPLSVIVQQRKNGNTFYSSLIAKPVDNGTSTEIYLEEKRSGIARIMSAGDSKNILFYLKSFLEDDSRRYGFPIRLVPVTDTLILTKKEIVAAKNGIETINRLRRDLKNIIFQNTIIRTGNYYFVSTINLVNQQTEVAVGIPVRASKNQPQDAELLRLPAGGRLLAGIYEGKYAGKSRLYSAMDKYVMDKKYKKVAQPLEKYSLSDTMTAPAAPVSLTLFYPIY